VWQSDITYIPVGGKHYYAVFIIDVYTKNIVGYQVSDHMRATANVKALQMALRRHPPPRIHHSDRGSQYTYKGYIDLLKHHKSKISMSLSAQENAYAERINRTIKEEYLDYWKPKSFNQLKRYVRKAVENYNNKRPHNHIGNCSPTKYEKQWNQLDENLKPKITIFNNEIIV
jgi:putative transposase